MRVGWSWGWKGWMDGWDVCPRTVVRWDGLQKSLGGKKDFSRALIVERGREIYRPGPFPLIQHLPSSFFSHPIHPCGRSREREREGDLHFLCASPSERRMKKAGAASTPSPKKAGNLFAYFSQVGTIRSTPGSAQKGQRRSRLLGIECKCQILIISWVGCVFSFVSPSVWMDGLHSCLPLHAAEAQATG